jgi:hypothetical protein
MSVVFPTPTGEERRPSHQRAPLRIAEAQMRHVTQQFFQDLARDGGHTPRLLSPLRDRAAAGVHHLFCILKFPDGIFG